jgi:uncharacterized coiled-coil protein SlyX
VEAAVAPELKTPVAPAKADSAGAKGPSPAALTKGAAPPAKGGKPGGSPRGRKTAKEAAAAAPKGQKTPGAKGSGEVPVEVSLSPQEKARLAKVGEHAEEHKASATTHETPESASAAARAAVKEPQAEADGKAAGAKTEALAENPPPDPELVEKVKGIQAAIHEKRPLKNDDLGKANPKDMAAAAGAEVAGDVKASVASVNTGYKAVEETPQGVVDKPVTPIAAEGDAPPAPPIDAASAAPDVAQPSEVSLDADKKAVEKEAKDAKLDHPNAKLVKEGPVADARKATSEEEAFAIWGPPQVVKSTKEIQLGAAADFKKAEAEALKKMKEERLAKLGDAHGEKEKARTAEEKKRDDFGKDLAAIYDRAELAVKAKLAPLVPTAMKKWDDGLAVLSANFDQKIKQVDAHIAEHKSWAINRIRDALIGLPDWIVAIFDEAENEFGKKTGDLALAISSFVNGVIRDCQKIIIDARAEIQARIDRAEPSLKDFALEQQAVYQQKFDSLSKEVEGAKKSFTQQISQKLTQAVTEKRAKIDELREQSKGIVQQVKDATKQLIDDPLKTILNALLKQVGIPPASFWALVDKFGKVVDQIADKPLVFANNLVAALKLGFEQFKDNIWKHLLNGLMQWLTSKLKDVGVQPPADFSVKSMTLLILQVLGISWPKIRAKLVKYIGEQNMKRIELAVEFLAAFINEGWDGVWKVIKDKLNPETIVNAVLDAVKSYIVNAIVKQATLFIVKMFNPAGIVFQALQLIYDAITWIMDNASRIFTLIEAIVNGASNIMAGAIGGAAAMIEKALAMMVPVVIDLFAKLVKLGDVPNKVKDAVKDLQKEVDEALDRVIAWIAGKIGLSKHEEKKGEGDIGESIPIAASDGTHTLYFEKHGDTAEVMVASDPMPVKRRLADFERRLPEIADASRRDRAVAGIAKARGFEVDAEADANQLVRDYREKLGQADADQKKVIKSEETLASVLSDLYKLFRENPGSNKLTMRASYAGNSGSGELSFDVTPAGRFVKVMTSGLFSGQVVDEMTAFASAAKPKQTETAADAEAAKTQASEAAKAGKAALPGDAVASEGEKRADGAGEAAGSALDNTAAAVSKVAAFRRVTAGELLHRADAEVKKQIKACIDAIDVKIGEDRGTMLQQALDATAKISDLAQELKKKAVETGDVMTTPVPDPIGEEEDAVKLSVHPKIGDASVTGLYRYGEDPRKEPKRKSSSIRTKLDALSAPEAKRLATSVLAMILGMESNTPKLPGMKRAHVKLAKRLATLARFEEGRSAGALLTVAVNLKAYLDGDIEELHEIYDVERFAHAEPGFKKHVQEKGSELLSNASSKTLKQLGLPGETSEVMTKRAMGEEVKKVAATIFEFYKKAFDDIMEGKT